MAWGRLDDRFCTHPKVLATSFEALGLFAVSISYAAAYETDGVLTDGAVVMLCRGNTALVDQLVSRGFWERAETGYKIHGFLDYNPSKAVLDQKRKETRNRVATHRKRNAVTNTDVTPPKRRVTPGRVGKGRDPSSSSVPVLSSERAGDAARRPAVFERAVTVIRGLASVPDDAAVLHDRVETALNAAGFRVVREAPASLPNGATGFVDLLAEFDGQRVVLELDARTPRAKSLHKLLSFDGAWRIAVLRGGPETIAVPNGIDAVVSVPVEAYGFDRFWDEYPKRVAKSDARIAWDKIKPDAALQDRIIAAVCEQRTWPQWQRDGGQFIPHPATWLHRRQWEDEAPTVKTPLLTPRGQQALDATKEWLRRTTPPPKGTALVRIP